MIESLPITLSYEISKLTCPEELRDRVLNEEIKTLKEFAEAKQNLLAPAINPATPIIEILDINQIFEQDFMMFNKNIKDFGKLVEEKFKSVPQEKKELLTKKIESINKEIEKLMKSL